MTVYELAKEKGFELGNKDLIVIGMQIASKAKESGVLYTRKLQDEDGTRYAVNAYPESFKETMSDCIIDYMISKK